MVRSLCTTEERRASTQTALRGSDNAWVLQPRRLSCSWCRSHSLDRMAPCRSWSICLSCWARARGIEAEPPMRFYSCRSWWNRQARRSTWMEESSTPSGPDLALADSAGCPLVRDAHCLQAPPSHRGSWLVATLLLLQTPATVIWDAVAGASCAAVCPTSWEDSAIRGDVQWMRRAMSPSSMQTSVRSSHARNMSCRLCSPHVQQAETACYPRYRRLVCHACRRQHAREVKELGGRDTGLGCHLLSMRCMVL
jgi:hypothetical protein